MAGEPQVFLCHAAEDKAQVQQIYLKMRATGLRPWMDKPPRPFELDGILPGEQWDSRIRNEIRRSAYFIAFLSQRSVSKTGYVQREFRLALDMMAEMPTGQIFLIPALMEPCEIPDLRVDTFRLKDLQWVSLEAQGQDVLINLLRKDATNRQALLESPDLLVLRPNTAEELLAAIGSNRIIHLSDRTYDLSQIPSRYYEHVEFLDEHDGHSVAVRHVKNMTLIADNKLSSKLVVTPRYSNVIMFYNCDNIKISGVTMGHEPDEGFCTGGVLQLIRCDNFLISGCDLFGCGTEGIICRATTNLLFEHSVIRDCSTGILSLRDSRDIRFLDSVFIRNKRYQGVCVVHCTDILFENCEICENYADAPLFYVSSSGNVRMVGGIIRANTVTALANDGNQISFDTVEIQGNSERSNSGWGESNSTWSGTGDDFFLEHGVLRMPYR